MSDNSNDDLEILDVPKDPMSVDVIGEQSGEKSMNVEITTKDADGVPKSQNFEIVEAEVPYEKKSTKDIIECSHKLQPKVIAKEVLQWLITNVESYMDNTVQIFKLDLVLESEEDMQQTTELQDLFRAIADDDYAQYGDTIEDLQNCREELNAIVEEAWKAMRVPSDESSKLAERLVFYYEIKGISKGLPIVQEQEAIVDILKFEYEAFNVGVKVLKGEEIHGEKEIVEKEKQVFKQYVIPEGFTVWIELAFKPKQRPVSMF